MSRVLVAFGALFLCFAAVSGALAQSEPKKSPFGVPMAGPSQTVAAHAERSMVGDTWSWLLAKQQQVNRELANAVRQMKTGSVLQATLVLGFLGFAYGVLHAAGPGHGKAVISSYVLANDETVRRGIMLSFLAAFIQALSAIVIVGVLAILLNATKLEINTAEAWIETISWGLVAMIGAWLLFSQVRALFNRRAAKVAAASHDHAAGHHHHDGSCCGHDHDHSHSHSHGHQAHDHAHDAHAHADDGSCCGHAHMPDPSQLKGPMSWSKALAIAFSVGIRPCTGAILVMIFALSQGLFIAGVFATFAMALGTAITVSALAALAVGSRELATRFAGRESSLAHYVSSGIGIAGAALVFLLGASFFVGSLGAGLGPL